MRFLLFAFFFVLALTVRAEMIDQCGLYQVLGYINLNADGIGYSLVVNKKTQSEYQLNVDIENYLEASQYLDQYVSAKILISKPLINYAGEISKLLEINPARIDPFLKSNQIKKIESRTCVK